MELNFRLTVIFVAYIDMQTRGTVVIDLNYNTGLPVIFTLAPTIFSVHSNL